MIDSIRIGSYVLSFDCFVVLVVVEKEEVEEIGVYIWLAVSNRCYLRVRAKKCDGVVLAFVGAYYLSSPCRFMKSYVGCWRTDFRRLESS